MTKLIWSETFQDLWEVYDDLLGEAATLDGRPSPTWSTCGRCTRSPCGRGRSRSGAAPARSSATSPPSACSACRGRGPGCSSHSPTSSRSSAPPCAATSPSGSTWPPSAGSSKTADGDGNPADAVEGRGRAGLARRHRARGVRRAGARPGRGAGHRAGAGRGGGAGAVAGHRARRRGDPARGFRRAEGGVAAPAGRGCRDRGAREPRPARSAAVEYGAIADVVVTPDGRLVTGASSTPRGSYDGTVRLADLTGGTVEELRRGPIEAEIRARAAVLVAADLVGIAREALTRTVAYDRERKQFGVPVGSFQAIKHTLADLHVADHHGRARRALRRARRRRRGRRTPRSPSPSPRPRRATRRWRAPAR